MPLRKDIKKVMVIGSGPIIIGQAAEFDYAGTQACRALKEEGLEVVLVNSNPATIMTDANMADRVYIEPLSPEFATQVIRQEKVDGLLPTLGGQVGLNLALQLAEQGVLEKEGVRLLGTPMDAIKKAEDRELFRDAMRAIGEPVPESAIVSNLKDAQDFAGKVGLPLIIRPAYTLGGTGGGIAHSEEELNAVVSRGLSRSVIHQVLIERCVAGWKELEFEVVRDSAGNGITVCSMENVDPIGIHTGDSIVTAPAQTLTEYEFQMLRRASLKIVDYLGIEGGCNVQFALDPDSLQYYVIEVNPRLSRSSALASKATGYPIAKVATKIAIGLTLDEINNAVTGNTPACFEPALDYVVVKFPRWPFDKFDLAERTVDTQMKSTGEVMAIDRTFEAALHKAIRSLEIGAFGLETSDYGGLSMEELEEKVAKAEDQRLFHLAEAFKRGMSLEHAAKLTRIDKFFLDKIKGMVDLEKEFLVYEGVSHLPQELLRRAKRYGFADAYLAQLTNSTELQIRDRRFGGNIKTGYKLVDTCAGEFEAVTPYYYSTYDEEDEAVTGSTKRKIVVLGAGPIRIGQGIEFDYCSVHSVWALREEGIESVIINNNPETVSTDFDTSDRLYFEPLVLEDVLNVLEKEQPEGVIVQFGGQTAINLAQPLEDAGIKILGTTVSDIDRAEDRERFDRLLIDLDIPKPAGGTAFSVEEATAIADRIGFPVLVRPSYVLGGRAMEIVYNQEELVEYMGTAAKINPEHPVLVDRYLFGKELEVDAVCDGEDVMIPGIMEHIERAGVHSGDSIAVYPPRNVSAKARGQIQDYTTRLALALNVKGMINIQYVLYKDEIYVLEVNPRSSRTVPYISKITGIPLVNLATKAILGKKLKDMGYTSGIQPGVSVTGVKAPVFSFEKLLQVDISLGPEMKSTGEVMGVNKSFPVALYKALIASGCVVPKNGTVLVTVADKDKAEALPVIKGLSGLGYKIVATSGTAKELSDAGISATRVNKIREGSPNIIDLIREGEIHLVINTLTKGKIPQRDGFKIRRAAVEYGIPCLTSLDTAGALLDALSSFKEEDRLDLIPLQDYLK